MQIPGIKYVKGEDRSLPPNVLPRDASKLENKKILLRRGGALGDTVFASSIASKLKAMQPNAMVTFDCLSQYVPLMRHQPDIDIVRNLADYVNRPESWQEFDYLVDFAGVIELGIERKSVDYYWLHLARAGLEPPTVLPRFTFPKVDFVLQNEPYMVLHVGGSNERKRWPLEYWRELIEALEKKSVNYFVVGAESDVAPPGLPKNRNLLGLFSLEEFGSIVANAKCFFGTDSGFLHLSGCCGVRSLSLWGPFEPTLTLPNYSHAAFLKAHCEHGPCHVLRDRDQPKACRRDCMARISPKLVVTKVFNMPLPRTKKNVVNLRSGGKIYFSEDAKSFDGETVLAEPVAPPPVAPKPDMYMNGKKVESLPLTLEPPKVSVVIPNYKTERFIPALYKSLHSNTTVSFETVLVTNGSSLSPADGKQLWTKEAAGFGPAVNMGVAHSDSRSEYLCLMNADVTVEPGWLEPMVRFLDEHTDVALVGNKHLDERGRINSLGSEFSWRSRHFEHVGRNARKHTDAQGPVERDMCTFACVLVRRSSWNVLGGIDEKYLRAYWEDADFCMQARDQGYKIYCVPESTITHRVGGSGSGSHGAYKQNENLFTRRWVATGKVDKFAMQRGKKVHDGDVVACYIVLNEDEYIQASLASVYDFCDRIMIVEGGNDFAVKAGLCGPDKHSSDRTVERIQEFPDPQGKIELVEGQFKSKVDQRNAYAARLNSGDWMFLMDGDEVFSEEGLWRLSYLMHGAEIVSPGYYVFWNNMQTVAVGVWDKYPQVKVVKWRDGYHYADHNCPSDGRGKAIVRSVPVRRTPDRLYMHYSWVKPLDKLRQKVDYYTYQTNGRCRQNYIEDVFLAWREDPKGVEERFGTHPFGGGSTMPFQGEHPQSIKEQMNDYKWA